MAATSASRPSRTPFVVLALIAIAAIVGIVLVRQGSGDSAAPPVQALPAPVVVPTKTANVTPVRHGRVTTWQIPESLVGLRSVAVDPQGVVWLTEQNRAQVDSLDGNRLTRYEVGKIFPDAGAFGFGWGPDG